MAQNEPFVAVKTTESAQPTEPAESVKTAEPAEPAQPTGATKKIKLIAVVGATASGKTALAAELARRVRGEVVSFDSMQIYRGMPVGTAQPTEEEKRGIPHHMIGVIPPEKPFSCAEYVVLARDVIAEIAGRGRVPVLCGGTGLYLDRLLAGSSFEETVTDTALREELSRIAAEEGGVDRLHELLASLDPVSAEAIHKNNVKRVIRAIEICRTTGKTKSELDRASREVPSLYDTLKIGIRFCDRDLLYRRIDRRVDEMLASGLVKETQRLQREGVFDGNATAAQAIGYKELFPYLAGAESLSVATERLKLATRHYAKRQLTWFCADPTVHWVNADTEGRALRPVREVFGDAAGICAEAGFAVSD